MILKPQDLLLALKVASGGQRSFTMKVLSVELGLSTGEVHGAMNRAIKSQLLARSPRARPSKRGRPSLALIANRNALAEFAKHGARYVFVPERGPMVRGIATAAAAPVLRDELVGSGTVNVWPWPKGDLRGESFSPLFPSAVRAALDDEKLYRLLALLDSLRGGGAREREMAGKLFQSELEVALG